MDKETFVKLIAELEHIGLRLLESGITSIEKDIMLSKLSGLYEQILQINSGTTLPSVPLEKNDLKNSSSDILDTKYPSVSSQRPEPILPEIISVIATENLIEAAKEETLEFDLKENLPVKTKNEPFPNEIVGNQIGQRVQEISVPPIQEKKEDKEFPPEVQEVVPAQKREEDKPERQMQQKKPEQVIILAEKFQNDKSFLNEALAKYQPHNDISKKYQTKPISDILSAINLNDKYIYIKELFNDDPKFFKESIEQMNSFNNFNDAVAYIDQHFKWDFNDFQVQKILELVHRRYQPIE